VSSLARSDAAWASASGSSSSARGGARQQPDRLELLCPEELGLHSLAVGDVLHGAVDPGDGARGSALGGRRERGREERAVHPAEEDVAVVNEPGRPVELVEDQPVLAGVGIDLCHRELGQLPAAAAEEPLHGGVHLQEPTGGPRAGAEDAQREVADQGPELLLAPAQRLLGAPAPRAVDEEHRHHHEQAGHTAEGAPHQALVERVEGRRRVDDHASRRQPRAADAEAPQLQVVEHELARTAHQDRDVLDPLAVEDPARHLARREALAVTGEQLAADDPVPQAELPAAVHRNGRRAGDQAGGLVVGQDPAAGVAEPHEVKHERIGRQAAHALQHWLHRPLTQVLELDAARVARGHLLELLADLDPAHRGVADDHDAPGAGVEPEREVEAAAEVGELVDAGDEAAPVQLLRMEVVHAAEDDRHPAEQPLAVLEQECQRVVVGGDDHVEPQSLELDGVRLPQVAEVRGVARPLGSHVLGVDLDVARGSADGGQHAAGLVVGPLVAGVIGVEQEHPVRFGSGRGRRREEREQCRCGERERAARKTPGRDERA